MKANNPNNNNKPLTLKEQLKQTVLDRYDLQEIPGVSRNTIRNLCKRGIISYTKVGRKCYFDGNEVYALLKRKEVMVPEVGKGKK